MRSELEIRTEFKRHAAHWPHSWNNKKIECDVAQDELIKCVNLSEEQVKERRKGLESRKNQAWNKKWEIDIRLRIIKWVLQTPRKKKLEEPKEVFVG